MQVYKLHFTTILVSIHLFPFRLTFFLLLLNVFGQNKTLKCTRDRIKLMERTECLISRWYRMQCVFFRSPRQIRATIDSETAVVNSTNSISRSNHVWDRGCLASNQNGWRWANDEQSQRDSYPIPRVFRPIVRCPGYQILPMEHNFVSHRISRSFPPRRGVTFAKLPRRSLWWKRNAVRSLWGGEAFQFHCEALVESGCLEFEALRNGRRFYQLRTFMGWVWWLMRFKFDAFGRSIYIICHKCTVSRKSICTYLIFQRAFLMRFYVSFS